MKTDSKYSQTQKKHKEKKPQKNKRLVFQKNRLKMQTCLNPC